MNLTRNQIMSILIAVLSVLAISTAQLSDLFGANTAKTIVSVSNLLNTILSSVMIIITGQSGAVKDVLSMPGVEKIDINGAASKTLATIAMDPAIDKIGPTEAASDRVQKTAAGE